MRSPNPNRMPLSIIIILVLFLTMIYPEGRQGICNFIINAIPSQKAAYTAIKAKVQTIQPGMTKDEVKKIMGEPSEISELKLSGESREIWKYRVSIIKGEYCYCEFYNNTVFNVMNEEEYKIMKKEGAFSGIFRESSRQIANS